MTQYSLRSFRHRTDSRVLVRTQQIYWPSGRSPWRWHQPSNATVQSKIRVSPMLRLTIRFPSEGSTLMISYTCSKLLRFQPEVFCAQAGSAGRTWMGTGATPPSHVLRDHLPGRSLKLTFRDVATSNMTSIPNRRTAGFNHCWCWHAPQASRFNRLSDPESVCTAYTVAAPEVSVQLCIARHSF